MAAATTIPNNSAQGSAPAFVPREHGATAMLLTPFFAAAILLRQLYWPELAALVAILCAFAIKDPLVVLARQRWVWKQEHPETTAAKRSAVIRFLLLAGSGAVLLVVRDWRPFVPLFAGAAAFTLLAVMITVRNRQRSEWFQVASVVALTSTCLMVCLAAVGTIPEWCWLLWLLSALQATAGIFVVHARLDARIAARKGGGEARSNRRAAFFSQAVLGLAGVFFAFLRRPWIATGLFIAVICYLAELRRQTNREFLQVPMKQVGLQALKLSTVYAVLIMIGLWNV